MPNRRRFGIMIVCALAASVGIPFERPVRATEQGTVVSATAERAGTSFVLSWTTGGDVQRVTIFEGTSPDQIQNVVADTEGVASIVIEGLDPAARHYFRVKGGKGPGVITAERGVPQIGVLNFRDVGGYATAPNAGGHEKHVRWGTFFRSGSPAPTSNQGFLGALGVQTIIDVRGPSEITASAPLWSTATGADIVRSPIFDVTLGSIPDPVTPHLCLPQNVSPSDPSHHYFPFDPVCFADQDAFFGPNGEFFTSFKRATFRAFVSGEYPPGVPNFGSTMTDALSTLLLSLTDAENLPLVWADTGGSARAGWGTAVVLLALGVPEEQVIEDYLLTNQFRAAANNAQLTALVSSGRLGKRIYLEPQLTTSPEEMEGAFDEIRQRYGTFEDYAYESLGITGGDLEQIRENLLKG